MKAENYIILTDQQLVSLSIDGDGEAFGHLFGRYRESMHKIYVQRTGGNTDDASDLVQDTFLKVWLKLDRYNPAYTFGQWIYTIARNTFIDYLRKRPDSVPLEDGAGRGHSTLPTPEESIIDSQQHASINAFLSELRPQYRRLIELRYYRDFSYEEIATELKIPLGTVKTQLHRARERLLHLLPTDE